MLALTLALAAPVLAQGPIIHVVQRGENLFRIALRYGVTVDALAAANGLSDTGRIYAGQRLVVPTGGDSTALTAPSSSGVHVVQRGENLFRIALRYGTTVQALAAANGIVNTGRVYAGQRLVLPGRATAPATSAQPASSGQTYTAVITPTEASRPIAYTWSPQPEDGQGTESADYRWDTPGIYTITLSAENCGGPVS
ncbi:MAG: hypothetical protein DRI80_13145, partial [Chloroflexota bacterium]